MVSEKSLFQCRGSGRACPHTLHLLSLFRASNIVANVVSPPAAIIPAPVEDIANHRYFYLQIQCLGVCSRPWAAEARSRPALHTSSLLLKSAFLVRARASLAGLSCFEELPIRHIRGMRVPPSQST
jgi:hypothetical protein